MQNDQFEEKNNTRKFNVKTCAERDEKIKEITDSKWNRERGTLRERPH